jgi:hypothetical protein
VTRRWRPAIEGTIATAVLPAAHVIAIGVPLARLVRLDAFPSSSALCCSFSCSMAAKTGASSERAHRALADEDVIYRENGDGLSGGQLAVDANGRYRRA